jgi:hypothetical protein
LVMAGEPLTQGKSDIQADRGYSRAETVQHNTARVVHIVAGNHDRLQSSWIECRTLLLLQVAVLKKRAMF